MFRKRWMMSRDPRSQTEAKIEAFIEFEAQVIASAPQPRAGFEQQLAQRLQHEFSQRSPRKRLPMPAQRFRFGHLSRRTAIILSILLIVGVGVVLAMSAALRQVIGYDAGLKAIFEQGLGHEIGISQSIEDFTVTLEWAYADGNRLTLAYMIAGHPGTPYTNLESHVYSLTLRDSGEPIPFLQGMSALMNQNGDIVGLPPTPPDTILTADRSLIIRTYDLSPIAIGDRSTLDLRLEADAKGVTLQKRTEMPIEQFNSMYEGPSGHFVFDFSVSLVNEQRIFTTTQTATDQDITITLEQVSVSPSQTRVMICFTPPDPARQWTGIPHLTTDAGEVPGGGGVKPFMDGDRTCDDYTYFAGMYDYHGEWQLEISELVGFGSGGGNDQQRIAGSWQFRFVVP
jgi:hypothetical protein